MLAKTPAFFAVTRSCLLILGLACLPCWANWTVDEAIAAAATPEGFIDFFNTSGAVDELIDDDLSMRKICNAFRSVAHVRPDKPSIDLVRRAALAAKFLLQESMVTECRRSGGHLLHLFGAGHPTVILEAALENHHFIFWAKPHKFKIPAYDLPPLTPQLFVDLRARLNTRDLIERNRVLHVLKRYLAIHDEKVFYRLPDKEVPMLLTLLIDEAVAAGDTDLSETIRHEEIENATTLRLNILLELMKGAPSARTQAVGRRLDLFVKSSTAAWLKSYSKRAVDEGEALLQGRWEDESAAVKIPAQVTDSYLEQAVRYREKLLSLAPPIRLARGHVEIARQWMEFLGGASAMLSPPVPVVAQVLLLFMDPERFRASGRIRSRAAEVVEGWRLGEETRREVELAEFYYLVFRKPVADASETRLFRSYIREYGESAACIETAILCVDRGYLTDITRYFLRGVETAALSPEEKTMLVQTAYALLAPTDINRLTTRAAVAVRAFLDKPEMARTCAQEIEGAG